MQSSFKCFSTGVTLGECEVGSCSRLLLMNNLLRVVLLIALKSVLRFNKLRIPVAGIPKFMFAFRNISILILLKFAKSNL